MNDTLHILFFLYKSKRNEKGTSPIFCRITFKQKRKQFSTGFQANEVSWNAKTQRVRGKTLESKLINDGIVETQTKLIQAFNEVTKEKLHLLIDDIWNRYSGTDTQYNTLIDAFNYHNRQMKELIGKDYVKATYDKFVVIQKHVETFLKTHYNIYDIALSDIKIKFLNDIDHYLKVTEGLNQNTINKIIERVKKVLKVAVGNGWITSDPFILFKKKKFTKEVVYLSNDELEALESHKFAQKRLEIIRDCFVFSCYTGLAYNEASLLQAHHLFKDKDFIWIRMVRQKTGRAISVPLLPKALAILEKYGYTRNEGLLLPIVSNQKMNSYIKEVADVVGIERHLTHHVARKTFASTVLLNNDIPIEVVSYLLGHSKISTTELHYAKIAQDSVIRHLKRLR